MSDPPPKPKPGSLRDRIAAFENKGGAPTPGPPPAPRPKPGGLSWKPKPPSPPSSPGRSPGAEQAEKGAPTMSAADAKSSIGMGGSLKERMAALQGRGGFGAPAGGGGPPPPRPAGEKPKWKPPPKVASPEEQGEGETSTLAAAISSIEPKSPPPTGEGLKDTPQSPPAHEGEETGTQEGEQGEQDPEEEERQRRAAIAARMARLGGARVGMGPPIFAKKPEVHRRESHDEAKPPPAQVPKAEPPKEEVKEESSPPTSVDTSEEPQPTTNVSEPKQDTPSADEPLPDSVPTSPPTEPQPTLSHTSSLAPESAERTKSPPTSMPVPAAPRRAAPPRKKVSRSPAPPSPAAVPEGPKLGDDVPTDIASSEAEVKAKDEEPSTEPAPPAVEVSSHDQAHVSADETGVPKVEGDRAAEAGKQTNESAPPAAESPVPSSTTKPEEVDLEGSTLDVTSPVVSSTHASTLDTASHEDEVKPPSVPREDTSADDVSEEAVSPSHESGVPNKAATPDVVPQVEDHQSDHPDLSAKETETVPEAVPEPTTESQAAPADEEEEDDVRRRRIAERLAKMGGVNPFGGPHAPARGPLSPPLPTSPPPQAPSRQASLLSAVGEDEFSTPRADAERGSPKIRSEVEASEADVGPSVGSRSAEDDLDGDTPKYEEEEDVQLGHGAEVQQEDPEKGRPSVQDDESDAVAPPPPPRRSMPPPPRRLSSVPVDAGDKSKPLAPELHDFAQDQTELRDRDEVEHETHEALEHESRELEPPPQPPLRSRGEDEVTGVSEGIAAATTSGIPGSLSDTPTPSQLSAPSATGTHPPPLPGNKPPVSNVISEDAEDEEDKGEQDAPPPLPSGRHSIPPPPPQSRDQASEDRSAEDEDEEAPPPLPSGRHVSHEVPPATHDAEEYNQPPPPPPPRPNPLTTVTHIEQLEEEGLQSPINETPTMISPEARRSLMDIPLVSPQPPTAAHLETRDLENAHPSDREYMDEDEGDPIDPMLHRLSRTSPLATSPPPHPAQVAESTDPAEDEEHARRRTIAERMAKLGGIRFGAPPPIRRPAVPTSPREATSPTDATSPSTGVPAQVPTAEIQGEEEEEEDEHARRERIRAKLAGMGGMGFGMLPPARQVPPPPAPKAGSQDTEVPVSPDPVPTSAPPIPGNRPTKSVPPPPEEPTEAEAEDDDDLEVVPDDVGLADSVLIEEEEVPPPPPARPPRPTSSIPALPSHATRVSSRDSAPARPLMESRTSEFVMVAEPEGSEPEEIEAEDAPPPPPRPVRAPPTRAAPAPPPAPLDIDTSASQWQLPSIPTGSLDLSGSQELPSSTLSDDSTSYPPTAPPREDLVPPPSAIDKPMTADELMAVWGRVGVMICGVAAELQHKAQKSIVGDGSYAGFVNAVLDQVSHAAKPMGNPPVYGHLVYAQTGAAVQRRVSDIMPGDVIALYDCQLKGHKNLKSYHIHVGANEPCVGVVTEFEPKKAKTKVLQANQHVGQQAVESVSYRLEDLKSGTVKIFRVLEA